MTMTTCFVCGIDMSGVGYDIHTASDGEDVCPDCCDVCHPELNEELPYG